jgi:hypothetical protein
VAANTGIWKRNPILPRRDGQVIRADVLNEQQLAPWCENASDLFQGSALARDAAEREQQDDSVECGFREGQLLGDREQDPGFRTESGDPPNQLPHHVPVGLDQHKGRHGIWQMPDVKASCGADFECRAMGGAQQVVPMQPESAGLRTADHRIIPEGIITSEITF